MNKIFIAFMAMIACVLTSCGDDDWGGGNAEMEHVYYFGFENWGETANDFNKNAVVYNVAKGATVSIPVQFHSERVRPYDVTVYYYVSSAEADLKRGTDYEVTNEAGQALTPDANGAFALTFAKAVKGVQSIYIKAGNTAGTFKVLTFDPNAGAIKHPDNITNSRTNDYEVRAFTQNYFVTVKVQ